MQKKFFLLFFSLVLVFDLTSCQPQMDENLHNKIINVWENNEPTYIIYQGQKYMYVGNINFVGINLRTGLPQFDEDVMLSWNGPRYWGYTDIYRSYTADNPLFIVSDRYNVYFHEDYDYTKDTFVIKNPDAEIAWENNFVIKNTDAEIVWEDIFELEQPYFNPANSIKIIAFSKQCPKIIFQLKLTCVQEQWYIFLPDKRGVWTVSDTMVQLLEDNEII